MSSDIANRAVSRRHGGQVTMRMFNIKIIKTMVTHDLSQQPKSAFADGQITLLNGEVLPCYPKPLTTDSPAAPIVPPVIAKERQIAAEGFFIRHAFDFYRHADQILHDSRLFLSPVPMINGLAYCGAFDSPILGTYIEWWLYSGYGVTYSKKGRERLTLRISGSPLSGCNHCLCIDERGNRNDLTYHPFGPAWHSFLAIHCRYTKARITQQSYPLEEAWERLMI